MGFFKQEDKEPVFDSVKTIIGMLEVSAEFAQNITFNQERIQKALPAGHLDATTGPRCNTPDPRAHTTQAHTPWAPMARAHAPRAHG